jgi:Concanavalin A-like lectin/glucanases superfamily
MHAPIRTTAAVLSLSALGLWGVASTSAGAASGDALLAYGLDEGAGTTASDASGNGRTGAISSATWSTSGRYGAALTFDGVTSRVSTVATMAVGSAFSMTGWVFNPTAAGFETIATHGSGRDVFLQDGQLSLFDGSRDVDLDVSVPAGAWAHIAVTGAGGTVRAFVNGVPAAPVTASTASGPSAPLVIGAWTTGDGFVDHFSGRIDEVRWYARQLSEAEVQADRATPVSGGTPPSTTTTTAPTTTAPTTTAPTTTAPTTTAPPSGGRSLRFYGNGRDGIDRVRIPLTPNRTVDVGGDFTIEWWMKVAGPLVGDSCGTAEAGWIYGNILLDRDVYGGGDYGDFGISVFGGGGGRIAFGVTRGSNGVTLCSTVGVADGAWHHVAVTRSSSSGALAIYVDGQPRGTSTGPTGDVSYRDGRSGAANDPYLVIGAEKHDAGSEFPSYRGWIDELRISRAVRYTAAFQPPRAALAADGTTVALFHADEASGTVLEDAAGSNDGALIVGGSPVGPVWTTDSPL